MSNSLTINGKEFNIKYAGTEFYKLTNDSEYHNGVQFRTGINYDPGFLSHEYLSDGIYFIELKKIFTWLYFNKKMTKIRKVAIPDDAKVYVGRDNFKADKLILDDFVYLDEFLNSGKITVDFCMEALKRSFSVIRYIPDNLKTEEFCLASIIRHQHEIKYVPNKFKTDKMWLILIIAHTNLLYSDSFNCWLELVELDASALLHIPDDLRTEKFYSKAINKNNEALHYIPEEFKTKDFYLTAIKQNKPLLDLFQYKTKEIISTASNKV